MFKKFFFKLLKILAILYIVLVIGIYFFQEKLFFHPKKIDKKIALNIDKKYFEDVFIPVDKDVDLHAISSKIPDKKYVKFLLHGNGGDALRWLNMIPLELHSKDCNYFILDYRGYGKSDGEIFSENQMLYDVQKVYDYLKTKYSEDKIIIEGYSMGTGLASYLASKNNPHSLILNAPYYNLLELSKEKVSIIPDFIVKYQFKTNEFLKKVKCPITIFHGTIDKVIPIEHSKQLLANYPKIKFIELSNVAHIGIFDTYKYQSEMTNL